MADYSWHVIATTIVTLGNFLGAEQVNSSHNLPEDHVLSIKKRKIGPTFIFLPKKGPIRWRAYWMHVTAQISFVIYLAILFVGRMTTGSLTFLTETIFVYYPILLGFSRGFWEIGIFIYTKIKLSNKYETVKK